MCLIKLWSLGEKIIGNDGFEDKCQGRQSEGKKNFQKSFFFIFLSIFIDGCNVDHHAMKFLLVLHDPLWLSLQSNIICLKTAFMMHCVSQNHILWNTIQYSFVRDSEWYLFMQIFNYQRWWNMTSNYRPYLCRDSWLVSLCNGTFCWLFFQRNQHLRPVSSFSFC